MSILKGEKHNVKELPGCFGRWLAESSSKCEVCSVQLECYGKMRNEEKKREKEERQKGVPWYKLTSLEEVFGVCETCG